MVDCLCVCVFLFPRERLESPVRKEAKPTRENRCVMASSAFIPYLRTHLHPFFTVIKELVMLHIFLKNSHLQDHCVLLTNHKTICECFYSCVTIF